MVAASIKAAVQTKRDRSRVDDDGWVCAAAAPNTTT